VNAVNTGTISIALACRTFQISETCYRYERKFDDENAEIADWLVRLTANRKTWGFGLCFSLTGRVLRSNVPRGCICATSKALSGTISAFTGFIVSWS